MAGSRDRVRGRRTGRRRRGCRGPASARPGADGAPGQSSITGANPADYNRAANLVLRLRLVIHIPALLQATDHALALFRAVVPPMLQYEIEHHLTYRIKRQSILHREDPPPYSTISAREVGRAERDHPDGASPSTTLRTLYRSSTRSDWTSTTGAAVSWTRRHSWPSTEPYWTT
ncbi:Scr1 family TA system antitoxin-like transcriptional regulator [Streptomyces antibioticus]|uniref:Scr1 family TA system antitoxin-like transcriptional regulator n=1 Tax=Streptomyces antibioticus TaxID=1890 RepID=UPI0033DD1118